MFRKILSRLALAVMLFAPAGLAHANFDGSANSFPANALRVTPFKSGKYRISNNKGYRDVVITLISQNRYRINDVKDSDRNGLAIFYQNTRGSLVLYLNENGKHGYFLATRSGSGITVYDTAYAANELLKGKSKDNIPEALEKMPYSKPAENQAFMKKVWETGNRRWFTPMFSAKPLK